MADLTPPPERPLDDATRARITARLTAATASPGTGERATRWLAPLGAAVAVVTIVSVVGWAAFGPEGVPGPAGPAPTTATAPSSSATSRGPEGSPTPSEPPSSQAPVPASPCTGYAERKVRGGTVVQAVALRDGSAFLFADDDRYLLCEDSGGIVTAHPDRSTDAPPTLDRELLGFSSSIYQFDAEHMRGSYVAGGRLPDDVTGLRYTFPGGDVADAAVTTDDRGRRWWIAAHVPQDGPLTDPKVNRLDLDPVTVEVARSGDAAQAVTLEWGRDDCTHVNHGC